MTRQLNGLLVCNSNWLPRLRISVISVSCVSYGRVLLERGTTHFPRITEASMQCSQFSGLNPKTSISLEREFCCFMCLCSKK
jgi:hypothetical protein